MTFQGKHKNKSVYRMVRKAYSLKIKTAFNLKLEIQLRKIYLNRFYTVYFYIKRKMFKFKMKTSVDNKNL